MRGVWRLKKMQAELNQRGIVLMYHRVTELDGNPFQLCVTPTHFDEQMQVLKKYGRPVQLQAMGKEVKKYSFGQKEIVVSLDDGYADNFFNAKPIMEKHGVGGTFFIVSGAIDHKEEFWWDELGRILFLPKVLPEILEWSIGGIKYRWRIMSAPEQVTVDYKSVKEIPQNNLMLTRTRLYNALWQVLSQVSFQEKKEALQQIADWSKPPIPPRPKNFPMSLQNLQELSRCSLFEIGAHTVCHPILTYLSLAEQETEMTKSKHDLEEMIGRPIMSFSYPHGKYSTETVKILKRLDFRAACTVNPQQVVRNNNPYLLPRFEVLNWDGDQFEKHLQKWMASGY